MGTREKIYRECENLEKREGNREGTKMYNTTKTGKPTIKELF